MFCNSKADMKYFYANAHFEFMELSDNLIRTRGRPNKFKLV